MNTPLELEQTNVLDVYNKIADHFDKTRHYIWPKVGEFINSLSSNSIIGDIGCGNGKNMLIRDDCTFLGCDNCEKFIDICKNKNLNVVLGSTIDIPFPSNHFDAVISIAVIHHLVTDDRRIKAIKELIRICKNDGNIMIQVWSDKANVKSTDIVDGKLIDWVFKKENKVYKRYYHMFAKGELESLINKIDNVEIIESFWEHDNWICIIKKN
jgi:SAM-dependent methyltransferase